METKQQPQPNSGPLNPEVAINFAAAINEKYRDSVTVLLLLLTYTGGIINPTSPRMNPLERYQPLNPDPQI